MNRLLIVSAFLIGATLTVSAQDRRYYDRQGKDYHTWNGQEDKAYRVYLGEQHRDYRQFHKVKPVQQQQYFRWRHEHPDNTIFRGEGR